MVFVERRSFGIVTFIVLLFSVIIFGAHFVDAASYGIVVKTLENDVTRNESASFEVAISNFQSDPGDFQVYTVDPGWNIKTVPMDLTVPSNSQKVFTLYLRPTSASTPGIQGIPVTFRDSNTGTVLRKDIVVSLRDYGVPRPDFAPTVAFDVIMPYEVDPRNAIPIRLELRNRNALKMDNLTITISSPHFSTSTNTNLGPMSEKTIDLRDIKIDPLTPPGEAEMQIRITYGDMTIEQLAKNYKIKEYTQITQQVTAENFFFKTTKTIKINNDGNVKNTALVSIPTSFVKSLFISSDMQYETETRDGQRVIFWAIPLDANVSSSFVYTENYRILVLLVLLLIIGVLAYFFLRSPIVAIKEAVAVAHPEGVSHIKVRIFVKNRSSKIMQGIQVTDRVPSLADVVKSDNPGSMTPTKVAVSDKQGTLLRWDLDVLEPFEERVLTYHVKSKLKIIGRMKLPNARIRFIFANKERVVYSNNLELIERFRDK